MGEGWKILEEATDVNGGRKRKTKVNCEEEEEKKTNFGVKRTNGNLGEEAETKS